MNVKFKKNKWEKDDQKKYKDKNKMIELKIDGTGYFVKHVKCLVHAE